MNGFQLPEGRTGKVLALSLLALLLIVFQLAVVSPLFGFYTVMAQTLQDRWDAVERSRNAVDDLPQLRAASQALSKAPGKQHALLMQGATDAEAAATLQSSLKDMIEEQGAKLISAQTLQPETQGQYHRVALRVALTADLAVLTTVLLGVEASQPVLSVANLDIRSAGGAADATLSVAMDVYGFRAQ